MSAPRYFTLTQLHRIFQINPEHVPSLLRSGILRGVKIGAAIRIEDPGTYLSIPDSPEDAWCVMRENEVAEILGISPRMVRLLADQRKIRPRRIKGEGRAGKKSYSVCDLRTLICYRVDPEMKGHEKRAAMIRWAIERITGRQLSADLHAEFIGDPAPPKPDGGAGPGAAGDS